MMELQIHSMPLRELWSEDQLNLHNSIDSLRFQHINYYTSVPRIIVCGDQSSGKSSVLEAITGISFPINSRLSTRFATEVVIRRAPSAGASLSIVPHESSSVSEHLTLGFFQGRLVSFDEIPHLINSSVTWLEISGQGRKFSKDLLRIEVWGPDRPNLTIMDLPGLIYSGSNRHAAYEVELVHDLVRHYMKQLGSIILAVVNAESDHTTQGVLNLARAADREGIRTLGIITKPDTLSPGCSEEAKYVALAKNQDVHFPLGWHVLKNTNSDLDREPLAIRDAKEMEFFSMGAWERLPPTFLGAAELRSRLSLILFNHLATDLPSLIQEIRVKRNACQRELDILIEPLSALGTQRCHLLNLSQTFQSFVKAAVDGSYNDPFFRDAQSESGFRKRIRAVVQKSNLEFAEEIGRRGHHREINESSRVVVPPGVNSVTRGRFMDHVQQLMERTKGRELPGTFNAMLIADLFLEQSGPWETIARSHVQNLWNIVKEFLKLTVTSITDAETSDALFRQVIEPAMDRLLGTLNGTTAELLTTLQQCHPITYDIHFAEALQDIRNERVERENTKIVQDFLGVNSLDNVHKLYGSTDYRPLVTALVQRSQPDLVRFACSEALDYLGAYYKVALKRFVDDVAINVIEVNLLSALKEIFTPVTVESMGYDIVAEIVGESEETQARRQQLTDNFNALTKGLETCTSFVSAEGLARTMEEAVIEPSWARQPAPTFGDGEDDFDESDEMTWLNRQLRGPRRYMRPMAEPGCPPSSISSLDLVEAEDEDDDELDEMDDESEVLLSSFPEIQSSK